MSVRPSADPRHPPTEFDEVVDWFESVSYGLVLLEEYPLADVQSAVERFQRTIREHLRVFDARLSSPAALSPEGSDANAVLRSDHIWFLTSIEQLGWFYRIVEGDDHGGHRQALGQYGRVLAEALRRHLREERTYLAGSPQPAAITPR